MRTGELRLSNRHFVVVALICYVTCFVYIDGSNQETLPSSLDETRNLGDSLKCEEVFMGLKQECQVQVANLETALKLSKEQLEASLSDRINLEKQLQDTKVLYSNAQEKLANEAKGQTKAEELEHKLERTEQRFKKLKRKSSEKIDRYRSELLAARHSRNLLEMELLQRRRRIEELHQDVITTRINITIIYEDAVSMLATARSTVKGFALWIENQCLQLKVYLLEVRQSLYGNWADLCDYSTLSPPITAVRTWEKEMKRKIQTLVSDFMSWSSHLARLPIEMLANALEYSCQSILEDAIFDPDKSNAQLRIVEGLLYCRSNAEKIVLIALTRAVAIMLLAGACITLRKWYCRTVKKDEPNCIDPPKDAAKLIPEESRVKTAETQDVPLQ